MRIKNTSRVLVVTTRTSRTPPTPELVLVAKGTFDLVENGPMTIAQGIAQAVQKPLNHDVYAAEDSERVGAIESASDFAEFKPHGEVLLTGACHATQPVTELPVNLTVGRWSKTLLVVGDRGEKNGAPARFRTMPMDYAHAYGGRAYPLNPAGRGHADNRQPNVTDPADSSDPPRPASFGPLSPTWPQRAGRVGEQYDDDYLDHRFPYYPIDFDWRFFQAAPPDQWIEGYWRGDEKVVLDNLLEPSARYETQLPGWRIRAFVNDDDGRAREVEMNLDTIAFDTDMAQCVLTWRGLTPIKKALATDVKSVLVVRELPGDPVDSTQAYLKQLAAFEANPMDLDAMTPPGAEDLMHGVGDHMPTEPSPPSGADVGSKLRAMVKATLPGNAEAAAAMEATMDKALAEPGAEENVGEVLATIEQSSERGRGPIPPYMPLAPGVRPRTYLRAQLSASRDKLAEALAKLRPMRAHVRGAAREKLDAQIATVEENLAKLDGPELRELDPTWRDVSDGEPGPGADLRGQDLTDRDLRGIDLRGAKLDGALLVRANLRGVDLEGACLEGAVVFGADLTGANLRGANLNRWNAADALLDEADMSGCSVEEAYFLSASMKGSKLDGASGKYAGFPEAVMTGASLTSASLSESDFRSAQLDDADLSRTNLAKAFFFEAKASGAKLDGANIDETSFLKAELVNASFERAKGERTVFLMAKLDGAKMSFAVLPSIFLDDATAPGASFRGADLRGGRLARMNLDEARFDDANLKDADLSDAEVNGATFRRANLYHAMFLRTAGKNCDMSGANTTLVRFGGRT